MNGVADWTPSCLGKEEQNEEKLTKIKFISNLSRGSSNSQHELKNFAALELFASATD